MPTERFIPACVGNSLPNPFGMSPEPVHPRVCGELYLLTRNYINGYGSSPRVWGTPKERDESIRKYRFIPACVGNSLNQIV